ncbi:MAG TPA: amylo-alpha-1,6-glucosidase [Bryobacteraceae bacterium]|nr:amylo-alpha-1,6-glucosidase [Bryobacteraceae bacterium]
MIRFTQEVTGSIDASASREWLETNGIGGFASSTITGMNTRRYHGLLVAATKPPVGRVVMLSKLEEVLVVGGSRYELSVNRYPGVIHPQGHRYLKEFRLDPFPVFTYQVDQVLIEKRVFMVHGQNTTVVEYHQLSGGECTLELCPLIAFRDYHGTTHRNESLNAAFGIAPGVVTLTPYAGMPSLHLSHNGDSAVATGYWYENFEYSEEQARGLDYHEDLFNPLSLTFTITRSHPAHLIASTEAHPQADPAALGIRELNRRAGVATPSSTEPIIRSLMAAAGQFIVDRGSLKTIIAGYHWFGDWGRDTMIALPGLTLVTGRAEIAKSILLAFAASLDRGMLPNRFPDAGEAPEYNTVDATLWFFESIRALVQYTADHSFVQEHLYGKLKDILNWHLEGTRYGIRVDHDALLQAGEPGTQLTWMDAKIGNWVVTPRHGKPVEVQALWYNALRTMEDVASRFSDTQTEVLCSELASRAHESFHRRFWNSGDGCLYDVVRDDAADASIRPNQILAVSLTHALLDGHRASSVVAVVQRQLLTPMGLRTLSPQEPRYRAHYKGGVWDRDSSYHQGTVWPWLMGPFITAYLKVNGGSEASRAEAAQWLRYFSEHMQTAGLGQVSEIADAEAPHLPRGCVAQAWSVAELLRAAVEDVFIRSGRPETSGA